MPAPLPSLFTRHDDHGSASRRSISWRAATIRTRATRSACGRSGVLLPDGAPELPEDTAQAARRAGQVDRRSRQSADRPRDGEPHLGSITSARGIVDTPNDFGRMGARPTHPELLDYLANDSSSSGCSVKQIHRLILLSNAYRQASSTARTPAAAEKDPENSCSGASTAAGCEPKRSATPCSRSRAS